MDGRNYVIDLSSNINIDELKIMSLSHFNDPAESMKTSLYHKILLVRTGQVLSEEKSIAEAGVKENDELLLLRKRLTPSPLESKDGLATKDESRKGPTPEEIKEITGELTPSKREPLPDMSNEDFHSELQKILVALVELAQKLLCLNPEAAKLFKQAEDLSSDSDIAADKDLVKQLSEMGFTESKCVKALKETKNSFHAAMEWLLKHGLEPEPEAEESSEEQNEQVEGATGVTLPESDISDTQNKNILQAFRTLRKKKFKPNSQAMLNLMEMGFEEAEVVEALRVSRNEQNAACEWLLGDRKTRPQDVEPEGLDPSSQMYKALVTNPNVQLGLNNPRCLLAMIQLLESPLTLHQWLSDPETGPFIVHITRIYHSWKYSNENDNASNMSK